MSQTIAAVAGHEPSISQPRASFWGLTLGSIGVVYGDIGTSPLYAMRESVLAAVGPDSPGIAFGSDRQIRFDPVARR